jgi:hypothetical protein
MRVLALALLMALVLPLSAHAARMGTVDIEGTEIYDGPGKGFRLVDKLPKGAQVATSNLPTEGFFKIRTSSGVVGWVSAESLVLTDPGSEPMAPMPSMPQAPQAVMPGPQTTAPDFRSGKQRTFVRARLLGGLTFFNMKKVNDQLNMGALANGAHVGGELAFMFTTDLAMIVRVERIIKNLVGEDVPTNKTYQFDVTSYPTTVGVEITLSKTPKFSSFFTMAAGLALGTELQSTGLDFTGQNVTSFKDTSFTGLAKLTLAWNFWKTFGVFAEGGYRILKSKEALPAILGNGSEIFNVNGQSVPIEIDLSGAMVGGGLTFVF